MSYVRAENYFEENRQHLSPDTNPALWNLSMGLVELTGALRKDLVEIRSLLDQTTKLLAQLRRTP